MPTVYGVNASPFVRKVRIFLAEKGIAYDLDPVSRSMSVRVPSDESMGESQSIGKVTVPSPTLR